MILVDFLFNIGVIISFAIISGALAMKLKKGLLPMLLQGLLFAFLAILGMIRPFTLAPGIFFDARTVVITLCSLFYGPVSTLVVVVFASTVRILLGGVGVLTGILTILSSALIGLLVFYWLKRTRRSPKLVLVYPVSLVVHLVMLLDMLTLPADVRWSIIQGITLPVLILYPVAATMGAWVLLLLRKSDKARQEAWQTKLMLDNLLEHSASPVVVWDAAYIIRRTSRALELMTGRSRDELMGQPLAMLFPAYQRALIMQLIQDSMQGALLENVEFSVEDQDRHLHVVRWNSAVMYAEDGRTALAGIAQGIDISDIKNTEQRLRANESKLRNYIDYAPIGIAVIDQYGRISEANRKIAEIVGWPLDQLTGQSLVRFMATANRFQRRRQLEQLSRGFAHQAEFPVRKYDGSIVHCAVTAANLLNRQQILFIADNSERKTIEAVMRAVATSNMAGSANIFRFLVQQLSLVLHCSVALIAEIDSANKNQAHTLAVCDHGKIIENFSFAVTHTATVKPLPVKLRKDPALEYAEDYSEIEAVDIHLLLPGTRSYWGLSLLDSSGAICGLIAVLDEQLIGHDAVRFNIMQTFAGRAASEIERKATEQKYQILFNEMLEGFAIHELVCNENGDAVDYRFLAVNPAFEKMTGLNAADIIGKTVLTVLPSTEAYWIENYGRVGLYGESLQFEGYSAELNRFYSTTAFQTQYRQFACIVTDITDRRIHETQMRQSLREKEILLKEIHHRVKNNLNIIASLLNLQSAHTNSREEAIAAFNNSRDQIMSMALVHEELYQAEDYANVNMPSYIERIKANLSHIYHTGKDIRIETEIQDLSLDVNSAIPCSLILNEMITNSYKYAFNGRDRGRIYICMKRLDYDTIEFIYADDGVGLPADFKPEESGSLGMTLIRLLTEQIEGHLQVQNQNGLEYRIVIPLNQAAVETTSEAAAGGLDTDG
ncbi:MAG: PAS domain S-box protein [Spirochaetes bacterium]|nr:PAS domain S-box protein [Spirochaetota bacterium]MBU0956397.1 PAS domain S-box protein [Spirochaetota bacterium]